MFSTAMLPTLLDGALITLEVTVMGFAVALLVSVVAGVAATSRLRAIRAIVRVYVEVFRGTSAIVQVFYFFFALPFFGIELTPKVAGIAALGLNFGAYGSEIVRGAIENVARGQREAALALNMTPWQTMRRIVLPQALVRMVPPFGNILIDLMKATSLLSLITIGELAFKGKTLLEAQGKPAQTYAAVLVVYFVIAVVLGRVVAGVERLLARRLHLDLGRA